MRNTFDRWTCATQKAVEKIGDKWTLFILREFIFGEEEQRFNQLLRSLKPISSRTLALKLKKLIVLNLLKKHIASSKESKYTITNKGLALRKSLQMLADWHDQHCV